MSLCSHPLRATLPKSFGGGLLPHGCLDFKKDVETINKIVKTPRSGSVSH
ncbi:MAG: hypothetical protein QXR26_04205 [Candidatus Caldarchaeum sp.]